MLPATRLLIVPLVIFVLGLGVATGQPAEEWIARYSGSASGSNISKAIAVDAAGNTYISGESAGSGTSHDYATVKYSTDGNRIWVARYNGPTNDSDYVGAMTVNKEGNVYVTGTTVLSQKNRDFVTIKYDSSGTEQWVASYDGPGGRYDDACAIVVNAGGEVYVAGISYGGPKARDDYVTIKYDSDGNELWTARYNSAVGNSDDGARAIAIDVAGNVYVTGSSPGTGTSLDYVTIKYDSQGNQLWAARYDGLGNDRDEAFDVAVDFSSNVYVTGQSTGPAADYDYATVKYDSSGNKLWVARYEGPANDQDAAYSLAVDPSGNVYVTGQSRSPDTDCDYATVKYAPYGGELWVARYNGTGNGYDHAGKIELDADGNIYVGGYSTGFGTGCDYTTVKYDNDGNQLWAGTYDGPASEDDVVYDMTVDLSGNVYVTGQSSGTATSSDFTTIKYFSPSGVSGKVESRADIFLVRNYPNPFNSSTFISYQVPSNGYAELHVQVEIYNIRGRCVTTLVDDFRKPGKYTAIWDAKYYCTGMYLYELAVGNYSITRSMTLLK